jgi:hypothetical protein
MRIRIDPSVTPAQRCDPRFKGLLANWETFFRSSKSADYKLKIGLHEAGHIVFAKRAGATDIRRYGPAMYWDSRLRYNCPIISKSSVAWTPNPNAPVIANLKAHIGGYLVRRELSDEPNDNIAIESDLESCRKRFDSNVGAGEQAFQKALEEAEHDILEDLKDPAIVAEIWSEARRFVNEIFPTPKKIKLGRNSLCTCGSRKKYKRCCINRIDRIDRLVPELVAI